MTAKQTSGAGQQAEREHVSPARRYRIAISRCGVSGLTIIGASLAPSLISAAGAATTTAHSMSVASAHGASLMLSRTTGLPGVKVGFHGRGFRRRESVVLRWGSAKGAKLKTVRASKKGAISGRFAVPNPVAGVPVKAAVIAIGASDHNRAHAAFHQSCTDEWTDLSGGSWATAKHWSTGAVPGSSDLTCITRAGKKNYTVTLGQATGSTSVGSLILGTSSGARTETLKIEPNGSDLHLAFGATSVIERHGAMVMTTGSLGGNPFLDGARLNDFGTLSTAGKGWSRYITNDIVNESSGTISLADICSTNCDVYFQGGNTITNNGTIELAAGAVFNSNQASFTRAGGSVVNHGTMELNNSTLTVTGGRSTGNAWLLRNGVILNDHAGTGSFTFQDSGTFNGAIPAGQTVTVDGDNGSNVQLAMTGTVTNNGTLVLTSDSGYNGPTNSWLLPANATTPTTLVNNGTLRTTGTAYSRYFLVNVTNTTRGHVELGNLGDDGFNYVNVDQGEGGTTFTNDGAMSIADGGNLTLQGPVFGPANFVQGSTGTLNMVNDVTAGTSSVINQFACSGAGCPSENIVVGGTLAVTTIGTPSASYAPLHSEQSAVSGSFATLSSATSYSAAYNVADSAIPGVVGDVVLTH